MSRTLRIIRALTRFRRKEDGAILVEFALIMPLLLALFAVTIEGTRLFVSYQAAISGVRDATRYLARVAPLNICAVGGSVGGYTSALSNIVENKISGGSVMPDGITVTSVTPSLSCSALALRNSPASMVTVSATIQITLPFSGVLGFFGSGYSTFTTTISDQNRVYGT